MHIASRRRTVRWLATAAGAGALLGLAPGAAAAPRNGADFSCRASAARVALGGTTALEPVIANAPDAPCVDDSASIIAPTDIGPLLRVDAANADTTVTPDNLASRPAAEGDSATAVASVTNPVVTIPGLAVTATVLSARAAYTCQGGNPVVSNSSVVTNLTINMQAIALPADNAPQTIDVPGVGTVLLNQTTLVPGRVTQRALEIRVPADGSVTNIVLGEAIADFTGNPCLKPPQCSDTFDNDGDGRIDAQDPGCLSGPNNTFNPNDDDERNPSRLPACSDARDNDGDGQIDARDPGCLSGPNGAFNPNDDDETNAAALPQCSDTRDNDGDGRIDAQDAGCLSGPNGTFNPNDNDERNVCSDGLDNDRDGRIDFPNDKGCTSASDSSEGTASGQSRLTSDPARIARRGAAGPCVRRSFVAKVTGRRIQRVTFSVDGKSVRTDRSSPYTARISTTKAGLHRVTARVVYLSDSRTAARTRSFSFRRCASGTKAVRFTG